MGLWRAVSGEVRLILTGADVFSTLAAMQSMGIAVEQVEAINSLQLSFTVSACALERVQRLCRQRGDGLETRGRAGLGWKLRHIYRRPIFLFGLLLLMFLSLWVPGRIFFIFVQGNQQLPSALILEKAAACGIDFGAVRRSIRSEQVKNGLLSEIPQLEWAGVNTQGCVAVISVREREENTHRQTQYAVSSLVAGKDAVIRDITVLNGTALCQIGQSVRAGQVLISGYTDCGLCIRAGNADGEIFGETTHHLTAIYPLQYSQRQTKQTEIKKFSLILRKNRINLQNSSGISGGECVRIYLEQYITLPGGFSLPIAICVERIICYETAPLALAPPEDALLSMMTNYLQRQMVAGSVCSVVQTQSLSEALLRMDASFRCYEMIGRVRPEECLQDYEDHGKNS